MAHSDPGDDFRRPPLPQDRLPWGDPELASVWRLLMAGSLLCWAVLLLLLKFLLFSG